MQALNRIFIFCILIPNGMASLAEEPKTHDLKRLALNVFSVLQRSCFECHGPQKSEGGLRLDSLAAIRVGGDSGPILSKSDATQNELLRRIQLPVHDEAVMPKRGTLLSKTEIGDIRQWLDAGMPWLDDKTPRVHWAYTPPKFPNAILESPINENPIDVLVKRQLDTVNRPFSPSEDLYVLARRIFLDTIGLPPQIEEVDAFVQQASLDRQRAVEQLVDRLLSLPQYGEKWARPWLDAARYADSHGFQRDDLHDLWAYRDWVIRALNMDMPFDQFTVEQLAGDLLPNAGESQRIATGFNRCAPCNVEAGTDPLENRFNQVVDRVNTLGYVWLGTTLECAQCHDHKYDPFTQRDYYGLFAFLNQTEIEAERANPGVPGSIRFQGPYMNIQDEHLSKEIDRLKTEIELTKMNLDEEISKQKSTSISNDALRNVLHPVSFESSGGAGFDILDDGSVLLRDEAPEEDTYTVSAPLNQPSIIGFLLETLTDASLPGTGPGRGDAQRPNFVLNHFEAIALSETGLETRSIKLTDARADFSQKNYDVSNAIDDDPNSAWAIGPQFKKPHWAAFRIEQPSLLNGISAIRFRLEQKSGNARTIGKFRISSLHGDYRKALPTEQKESAKVTALRKSISELEGKLQKVASPRTLVMRELNEPRESTMFARGDYRQPTESIAPSTPSVLHRFGDKPRNRLGLAQWLVSPDNPLVARVVVNRIWAEVFGAGLVTTPEDFGVKGEPPTHPELLDWLAIEFVQRGWSQKHILRQILLSQTYQQSSKTTSELREVDASNRTLARGPRFRLPAESIRDNALAIGGQLDLKQFGPPIRPPQPAGLWRKVGGQQYDYEVSSGTEKYRRGIYVILKRMSPYPSFINFDATARLACRVNRGRSNTPLQALNLLNDPVFVDAAVAMAERIQQEKPTSDLQAQLRYAFRLALARPPKSDEIQPLCDLWYAEFHEAKQATDPPATERTASNKAWFAVTQAILNLDETITKE